MRRSRGTGKEDLKKVEGPSKTMESAELVEGKAAVFSETSRSKKTKKDETVAVVSGSHGSLENEELKVSRKGILKTSTLTRFLPNAVTVTAMCFGLSAIRLAQCNEWEYAVLFILISALLDMFDGKIARFLDQSSTFGLELDSLSDLVCFGVAPSIVLYLSTLQQVGKVGWGACMFYTICCAMRLARFNVAHACSGSDSDLDRRYFVGIPAPAGAIIALFPLILFFETESFMIVRPVYVAFFLVFSGCMMISTIRTFSSKIVKINCTNSWVALAVMSFIIVCFATRLWMTLSVLTAFYLVTVPYGIYKYSETLKAINKKG